MINGLMRTLFTSGVAVGRSESHLARFLFTGGACSALDDVRGGVRGVAGESRAGGRGTSMPIPDMAPAEK